MSLRPCNCVIALERLCPVEDSGAPLGVNRARSCASVNLVREACSAALAMAKTKRDSDIGAFWTREERGLIDTLLRVPKRQFYTRAIRNSGCSRGGKFMIARTAIETHWGENSKHTLIRVEYVDGKRLPLSTYQVLSGFASLART